MVHEEEERPIVAHRGDVVRESTYHFLAGHRPGGARLDQLAELSGVVRLQELVVGYVRSVNQVVAALGRGG